MGSEGVRVAQKVADGIARGRVGHTSLWLGLALLVAGFVLGVAFQRYVGFSAVLPASAVALFRGGAPAGEDIAPGAAAVEALYGKSSLFILAGQSNMSGRGLLPLSQIPHPSVVMFGNDYRWKPALEPVDDATGQVDVVSRDGPGDPPGYGPALSFGVELATTRPDLAIGLIPCAKGNTTIGEWQKNVSDRSLYGSCLKRVRAASVVGEVAGLLFFQGESDALTPSGRPDRILATDDYADRFAEMVAGFRDDLSAPRLPVVFAQIGRQEAPEAYRNWEIIRQQQRSIRLPCTTMIRTDDLPLGDAVHFSSDAYREIGRRFAAAYLSLTESSECG
jgi:Carbohydrate esterase, sialic acid-specific acetylesterase